MKRSSIIYALILLLAAAVLPQVSCDLITGAVPNARPAPATLLQTGGFTVTIGPVTDDPEGDISFENVTVEEGVLEKDYYEPSAPVKHKKGDPAFLISGTVRNQADRGYWIAYHAASTDDKSPTSPCTLESGPIIGVAREYIEAESTTDFMLHLSWSANATSFVIHAQKSAIMPP